MLCIKNGLIHDAVSATPYVGDILVEMVKLRRFFLQTAAKTLKQ